MSLKSRLKEFGTRANRTADRAIGIYNEKVDKITEPSVDVGLDQKTMLYIGVAIVAFLLFWKRK